MPGKILISSEYPQAPFNQCSPIVWDDTNNTLTANTTGPIPLGLGWWCHIHPVDNTKLLVLSELPYWSHNNGATWTAGTGVVGSKNQRSIKFGSNNNAYYCGFPDTGTSGCIFKSTDQGVSWTDVTPGDNSNLCTGIYPIVSSFLVSDDCVNDQFSVEVNIASFGGSSGASISYISNHELNPSVVAIPVAALGTNIIGPFASGERVKIIVSGNASSGCNTISGWLHTEGCVVYPNCAIVNTYYYCPRQSATVEGWAYDTLGGGSGIARLRFAQGSMDPGTVVRIYEGLDNTGAGLIAGSFADLSSVEVFSASGQFYIEIDTSSSQEATCDAERSMWIYDIDCLGTCLRPGAFVSQFVSLGADQYDIEIDSFDAPTGFLNVNYTVNNGPAISVGPFPGPGIPFNLGGTFECGDIVNIIIKNDSESDPSCVRNDLNLGWIYINDPSCPEVQVRTDFYLDLFTLDDNRVFAVTNKNNPYGTDSFLIKTLDGGNTWIKEFRLNDVLPLFNGFDVARRIWVISETEVYILGRNKLYKAQKLSGVWNGTTLWNFLPEIATNWNQLPTGPLDQFNDDDDFTFDQIHVHVVGPTDKRVWLFGNYGLMARSTVQDTTYQFINTNFVINDTNNFAHSTGYFESPTSGWIAYSNVLTGEAGIWSSSSSGDGVPILAPTINYPQSGGNRWVMQNMWFSSSATVESGCTNSDACNYDSDAVQDDNSCQFAVVLSDCETGDQIVTTNPDAFWYACSDNYIDFNIANIVPIFTVDHTLTVSLFDGVSTNAYSFNYQTYMGGDPVDLPDFLNAFCGWWNTNIATNSIGRAYRIPGGFNTLSPGGNGGVRIILNSNYITVSYSATNLLTVTFTQVVAAQQGKVLRIAEYPDQCWRACGFGDCNEAETTTITDVFDDCFTCVPYRNRDLCLNCNTMVTVNDLPISECPDGCINVGDFININLAVGFPIREQIELQPEEYTDGCCSTCKLTLNFSGDQTEYFPVGSVIGVWDLVVLDTIPYTVESVSYDSNTDLTTITTEEFCSNTEIGNVTAFYQCECEAVVRIERDEEILINESYECEDGYIQQGIQYSVTEPGEYLIRIDARDCGGSSVCEYRLKICPRYSIYKDCHDVTFTNETPNNAPSMILEIFDTEDNVILEPTLTNLTSYTYEFEADGVYRVRITPTDSLGVAVGDTEEYYIFVLCSTISCLKKLMLDLWCNDDDGCCDGCTDEERKRRDQINRIMAIASMLFANQYVNKINFILDKNENINVLKTAELLERLTLLIDRCGECENKRVSTKKSGGCQNC